MIELIGAGANVLSVAALVGIFYRLGCLTAALGGVRERVLALEGWRDLVTRNMKHGRIIT